MSYILDALKRAEAQRERGITPGLHSRHSMPVNVPQAVPTHPLVWLAITALLMTGLVAGSWWWQSTRATAVTPSTAPKPALVVVPAAPVAPPASITVAAAPQTTTAPMVPTAVGKPVSQTTKQQPKPNPSAQVPSAAASVPLWSELPELTRSQIPKITITGSVYASTPQQRLLLVNNLVLKQGSQVAPDLILEEIQSKYCIFNYRGTRFRLAQ